MSVLAVDPDTGALLRVRGSYVRISGAEEIAQGVRIRLRLIRGEVLLDQSAGCRYVGLVFVKGTPPQRIENEIIEQVLQVPGIVSVDSVIVTADYANRLATVEIAMTASVDEQRTRILLEDSITLRPAT